MPPKKLQNQIGFIKYIILITTTKTMLVEESKNVILNRGLAATPFWPTLPSTQARWKHLAVGQAQRRRACDLEKSH